MMTTLEMMDGGILNDDHVAEALRRWQLSPGPELDRARKRVRGLARGAILWGVVDPDELPRPGGWGSAVYRLVLGAGTVGRELTKAVEEGDPWLKAMATAALGQGQERFFRRVEEWARDARLPVGAFHTPGSAGEIPLTMNVPAGRLLRVDEIHVTVGPDGWLDPAYSWIGIVPLGSGGDRVSFLCGRCPYAPSCPLRRDDP